MSKRRGRGTPLRARSWATIEAKAGPDNTHTTTMTDDV